VVCLASLTALAVGCGGGDTTVIDESETVTVTESESTDGSATSDQGGLSYWQSPSGNIGCAASPDAVRCDIAERDWEPRPPPADCPTDYGQGVELDAGGTHLVCAGDTVLNSDAEVLDYGESITVGSFVCSSTEAAMTCGNPDQGEQGFSLARDGYDTGP
jgi:hypothetical protein